MPMKRNRKSIRGRIKSSPGALTTHIKYSRLILSPVSSKQVVSRNNFNICCIKEKDRYCVMQYLSFFCTKIIECNETVRINTLTVKDTIFSYREIRQIHITIVLNSFPILSTAICQKYFLYLQVVSGKNSIQHQKHLCEPFG